MYVYLTKEAPNQIPALFVILKLEHDLTNHWLIRQISGLAKHQKQVACDKYEAFNSFNQAFYRFQQLIELRAEQGYKVQ
ncbi:hypothetical protein [Spartinivicinus poritis]|uniref:Uncharacterized protein n=1 Tax=Spartinivicinus poritis TaxID=2994640 RepID=A0ABT5U606_9GAMM|nr:hypothetical protein [Spartinivicinus sp. A2-2]MDE1460992.1 hypothetical protein [Spartinivicinus sp. A2-2]